MSGDPGISLKLVVQGSKKFGVDDIMQVTGKYAVAAVFIGVQHDAAEALIHGCLYLCNIPGNGVFLFIIVFAVLLVAGMKKILQFVIIVQHKKK